MNTAGEAGEKHEWRKGYDHVLGGMVIFYTGDRDTSRDLHVWGQHELDVINDLQSRLVRAEALAGLATWLESSDFADEVARRLLLVPNSIGVNRLMRAVRETVASHLDALTASESGALAGGNAPGSEETNNAAL